MLMKINLNKAEQLALGAILLRDKTDTDYTDKRSIERLKEIKENCVIVIGQLKKHIQERKILKRKIK